MREYRQNGENTLNGRIEYAQTMAWLYTDSLSFRMLHSIKRSSYFIEFLHRQEAEILLQYILHQ
jgi:hypothetical protein